MQRISSSGTVILTGSNTGFQDENDATGIQGTVVNAVWLNGVQESLMAVLESANLTAAADATQLLSAIRRVSGTQAPVTVTGATTLTADTAGYVLVNASSSFTVTLPAAAAASGSYAGTAAVLPLPCRIARIDAGGGNTVTLAAASGDTVAGLASVTLGAGQAFLLVSDGAHAWRIFAQIGAASGRTVILGNAGTSATSVTGTFTVPAGVSEVDVIVTAPGGPGAGGSSSNNGGCGGAGATGMKLFTGLHGGETITYSIGPGAAGGAPTPAAWSTASNASITYSGTTYSATAGVQGVYGSAPSGGAGGTVSGFDINIAGGAGSDVPGSVSNMSGGLGGASYWGGGGRASNGTSTLQKGAAPGSGGGGSYGGSTATGGDPAPGQIVFRYR